MDLKTSDAYLDAFDEWWCLIITHPADGTAEHARMTELEAAIDAWEAANPPPDPKS